MLYYPYIKEHIKPSAGIIIYIQREGIILVKEKIINFSFFNEKHVKRYKTLYKIIGGKESYKDVDIRDIAIRETQEEIGVDLHYKRDQLRLIDVNIRKGFRHAIFRIDLPSAPIFKIGNAEIEDVKIISSQEWPIMRAENEILYWHANIIEREFPEYKYLEL